MYLMCYGIVSIVWSWQYRRTTDNVDAENFALSCLPFVCLYSVLLFIYYAENSFFFCCFLYSCLKCIHGVTRANTEYSVVVLVFQRFFSSCYVCCSRYFSCMRNCVKPQCRRLNSSYGFAPWMKSVTVSVSREKRRRRREMKMDVSSICVECKWIER